jgi:Flp pilus assembly protein TadG
MMMQLKRRRLSSSRGNAYVEFGLLCPLLVAILGSVADFGLSIWSRARLSDAVSHGAQYAAVVGPGVSGANVQSAVSKSVTPLSGVSVTVTGPACYCVSGSPAALSDWSSWASGACSKAGNCASGDAPGLYMQIAATYTYSPIMPFYAKLASATLTENAVVRLQ